MNFWLNKGSELINKELNIRTEIKQFPVCCGALTICKEFEKLEHFHEAAKFLDNDLREGVNHPEDDDNYSIIMGTVKGKVEIFERKNTIEHGY